MGLGSTWIGAFDEAAVRSICGIPEEVQPQAIVAIGYAREIPEKPPKYPLETLIYFGSWRRKMRDPSKYMNDYATILARKATAARETMKSIVGSAAAAVKEAIKKS